MIMIVSQIFVVKLFSHISCEEQFVNCLNPFDYFVFLPKYLLTDLYLPIPMEIIKQESNFKHVARKTAFEIGYFIYTRCPYEGKYTISPFLNTIQNANNTICGTNGQFAIYFVEHYEVILVLPYSATALHISLHLEVYDVLKLLTHSWCLNSKVNTLFYAITYHVLVCHASKR